MGSYNHWYGCDDERPSKRKCGPDQWSEDVPGYTGFHYRKDQCYYWLQALITRIIHREHYEAEAYECLNDVIAQILVMS